MIALIPPDSIVTSNHSVYVVVPVHSFVCMTNGIPKSTTEAIFVRANGPSWKARLVDRDMLSGLIAEFARLLENAVVSSSRQV